MQTGGREIPHLAVKPGIRIQSGPGSDCGHIGEARLDQLRVQKRITRNSAEIDVRVQRRDRGIVRGNR